jgi:hypothetical protein
MERERAQQTPEQLIERRFGKETLATAEGLGGASALIIKDALVGMSTEEGSTREQDASVEKYLDRWRDFLNGLTARTASVNAASPEIVATVMDGANALLSVEPTHEGKEAATKMIEALKKRYGA